MAQVAFLKMNLKDLFMTLCSYVEICKEKSMGVGVCILDAFLLLGSHAEICKVGAHFPEMRKKMPQKYSNILYLDSSFGLPCQFPKKFGALVEQRIGPFAGAS